MKSNHLYGSFEKKTTIILKYNNMWLRSVVRRYINIYFVNKIIKEVFYLYPLNLLALYKNLSISRPDLNLVKNKLLEI